MAGVPHLVERLYVGHTATTESMVLNRSVTPSLLRMPPHHFDKSNVGGDHVYTLCIAALSRPMLLLSLTVVAVAACALAQQRTGIREWHTRAYTPSH